MTRSVRIATFNLENLDDKPTQRPSLFILVTRDLLTFYRSTEIHNEVLPDESGSSDVNYPESDHAPIIAEFILP